MYYCVQASGKGRIACLRVKRHPANCASATQSGKMFIPPASSQSPPCRPWYTIYYSVNYYKISLQINIALNNQSYESNWKVFPKYFIFVFYTREIVKCNFVCKFRCYFGFLNTETFYSQCYNKIHVWIILRQKNVKNKVKVGLVNISYRLYNAFNDINFYWKIFWVFKTSQNYIKSFTYLFHVNTFQNKGFPNRGDMILNVPIGLIWTEIFDVCCQLWSVRFAI